MSSSADKKDTKEPTLKEKVSNSVSTVLKMAIYIVLGIYLCYLKIIFGDLARNPSISHRIFTEGAAFTTRSTTPSVDFYCKEDNKNYVKQIFVSNPNFITEYIAEHFSTSGKDQLLKFISLETSYVILSAISILSDIPDWIIILIGPLFCGILLFAMMFFMWLMLSYYIFNYYINGGHAFSKIGLGWFVGIIVWFVVMINFGMFVVPVAVIYGFVQLLYILKTAKVNVLKPDKTLNKELHLADGDYDPYGFKQYLGDTLGTNFSVQLLFFYTVYQIFNYFTTYSYLVIVFFIALLVIFKGPITFLKKESLNKYNWTPNKESIYLPYSKSVMNHLKDIGMQILKQVNDIGVAYATEAFGKENVDKAKDLVQNFSTEKAKTAAKEGATYLHNKLQNKLKTIAEKVKSSSDSSEVKSQVGNPPASSSENR